jgi:hypothetical protein
MVNTVVVPARYILVEDPFVVFNSIHPPRPEVEEVSLRVEVPVPEAVISPEDVIAPDVIAPEVTTPALVTENCPVLPTERVTAFTSLSLRPPTNVLWLDWPTRTNPTIAPTTKATAAEIIIFLFMALID